MVFKRCTINGQDFAHNPTLPSKASMGSLNHFAGDPLVATPGGGRTIEVNSALNERFQGPIDLIGKEAKMNIHPEAKLSQDFFLVLAVCNTVIVAKHPHRYTKCILLNDKKSVNTK